MDEFRKQISTDIILTAIFIIIFSGLLIFIGYNISSRVSKITSFQKELNHRTSALESLATLRQDYLKAKPYFKTLQTILPTKDEWVNFPKDLNEIAKANRVSLGLSFGGETAGAPVEPSSVAFNLSLSAKYNDLVIFLKSAEKSRYFISIESLDLTGETQTQKFSGLISGRIFGQ